MSEELAMAIVELKRDKALDVVEGRAKKDEDRFGSLKSAAGA